LRRHRRAVTAAAAPPPPPPPPRPPPPAARRPSGGRRRAASAATAAARSGRVRVRRGDSRVGGEDSAGTGGRVVAAPAWCGAIGGADARCRDLASLEEAAHSSLTIKIPCRVPSGNVQMFLSILAFCCRPAAGRIRCRLAHLFHTSLGDRTPTHCGLWPCRELSALESVRGAVATNQPSSERLLCSRLGLRDSVCALGCASTAFHGIGVPARRARAAGEQGEARRAGRARAGGARSGRAAPREYIGRHTLWCWPSFGPKYQ